MLASLTGLVACHAARNHSVSRHNIRLYRFLVLPSLIWVEVFASTNLAFVCIGEILCCNLECWYIVV